MFYCPCSPTPLRAAPPRTQVGEFYEAVGTDAVLLVQHAGLNPMGAGNPPRAGCPRQNLRRTVEDLVKAGLSVAVCEEARRGRGVESRRLGTRGARGKSDKQQDGPCLPASLLCLPPGFALPLMHGSVRSRRPSPRACPAWPTDCLSPACQPRRPRSPTPTAPCAPSRSSALWRKW